MKKILIQYIGGPSSGKTTNALQAVSLLKRKGINAVYVREEAHDLVLVDAKTPTGFSQYALTLRQLALELQAFNKYDVVVSDTSPLLCEFYCKHSPITIEYILALYEDLNIELELRYLKFDEEVGYISNLRFQDKEEAIQIGKDIELFINNKLKERI